ncbi:TetR/AcrR family transcriptional regulator [Lederbergia galactosidilytica]|uniref:TetR family transcriptional regulator n=1 Tax=Lederbergia galactosidilytica TaxID=217031 RepID=A0A177ZQJ3_9BACI|nr:TetR/AcrR family transcriptional regulator [Lederbergia galactosidilytica]MBP1914587.1 AcrR family transcriptional regulator [Lederbergia galactosidilytica]OAK69148.1 TetR family transcriptional regulator [Lederbergia galactosidilytica]
MPKIVDHEKRRKQIAKATWKVILEQGMEGATVRNIAQEAGLSLGALRYYFSTQDELFVYAMKLVKANAAERINKIIASELPPFDKVMAILLEVVPIDPETMAEMEVWFAYVFYTRHKEDVLAAKKDEIFKGMRSLLLYLQQQQVLLAELDIEMETERLYALIDGLALHVLLESQRMDKERIVKVIQYHMEKICIDGVLVEGE